MTCVALAALLSSKRALTCSVFFAGKSTRNKPPGWTLNSARVLSSKPPMRMSWLALTRNEPLTWTEAVPLRNKMPPVICTW